MRPASRMESFRLSLPPGTLDSWNMPPHRRGAVSVHVRSAGLRRNQSSVLSRRIPLTRIGSSVSARTRGKSASAVRTIWCKTRLSPRACSRTARRLIELTTSRSNLSSGFIWRNASRAGGSEREVPRAFAVRLAPTAVLLTSSDTGGRRAMSTAGGTKGISTNQPSYSAAPGSINPSLAIIVRDRHLGQVHSVEERDTPRRHGSSPNDIQNLEDCRSTTFGRRRSEEENAPGGKSVHWQANPASPSSDMPVESFYRWASEPHLRPVPGTAGQRLILTCTKLRALTTGFRETD